MWRLRCLAASKVLHKSFGTVKLVDRVFISTLFAIHLKENSMLLSVTVALSFVYSLLGLKYKSERSVERKDVEGNK